MNDPVAISAAIYRRLLFLYPAKHRREFGDAMTQLFRDQCRDAWAARRWIGLCALWRHACFDLAKTAIKERIASRSAWGFGGRLETFRLALIAVLLGVLFYMVTIQRTSMQFLCTATFEVIPGESVMRRAANAAKPEAEWLAEPVMSDALSAVRQIFLRLPSEPFKGLAVSTQDSGKGELIEMTVALPANQVGPSAFRCFIDNYRPALSRHWAEIHPGEAQPQLTFHGAGWRGPEPTGWGKVAFIKAAEVRSFVEAALVLVSAELAVAPLFRVFFGNSNVFQNPPGVLGT